MRRATTGRRVIGPRQKMGAFGVVALLVVAVMLLLSQSGGSENVGGGWTASSTGRHRRGQLPPAAPRDRDAGEETTAPDAGGDVDEGGDDARFETAHVGDGHLHVAGGGGEEGKAKRRRLAIVTIATTMNYSHSSQNALEFAVKPAIYNRWAYAARHKGFDVIVEDAAMVDFTRNIAWSKLRVIKKWMPHYDWVMWVDIDALFMNFDIDPLVSVIDARFHLFVTTDWYGFNLGVFFVQSTPFAAELLERWWAVDRRHWIPFHEQSALSHLVNTSRDIATAVRSMPSSAFNSYPVEFCWGHTEHQYHMGHFVAHFPDCRSIRLCDTKFLEMYDTSLRTNTVPEADLERTVLPPAIHPGSTVKFVIVE